MKKKVLVLALVLVLVVTMLAACGGNKHELVGKWEGIDAVIDISNLDPVTVDDDSKLEIKNDNTATFDNDDLHMTFTWEVYEKDEKIIILKADGKDSIMWAMEADGSDKAYLLSVVKDVSVTRHMKRI